MHSFLSSFFDFLKSFFSRWNNILEEIVIVINNRDRLQRSFSKFDQISYQNYKNNHFKNK